VDKRKLLLLKKLRKDLKRKLPLLYKTIKVIKETDMYKLRTKLITIILVQK